MKKRTFLKISSAMLTGAALSPIAGCGTEKKGEQLKNWAGNLSYSTSDVLEPVTVEDVQEIIKTADKLRALGTRHCFNTIADSDALLVSTRNLNDLNEPDTANNRITVGAGIRYGDLCKYLDERGFAIHNLASLPHISVAGACATATHGSGVRNGNLATAVSGIEFVSGKGDIVQLSRDKDGDTFKGAVVALGSLGIVTKVTLDLIPTFSVRQNVYLNLPVTQLEQHFDEIMSSGYSVSLFTDWQTENMNQLWIKRKVTEGEAFNPEGEFFGAALAQRNVHPIIEISAENCTEQMGVAGPWYERLPHFKMDFTPSSGEELQAEYFVPREKAFAAIKAVETLRQDLKNLLLITEIRTVDADDLWMSMAYQRPSVAIHFTLKQDIPGVVNFLPKLEQTLAPFEPRPHWGKLFTLQPSALHSRYGRYRDFLALASQYDPAGKFRNTFMTENFFS
ncbi:MAG TPA: FAD-binding protein [Chryseolinea sp.]|nr:FAD-binding protein [Chryseolinea sp.]